jgi:hypothetical protein
MGVKLFLSHRQKGVQVYDTQIMLCDKRQCSWPRGPATSPYHKRPFFALFEPMEAGRGSTATGGPPRDGRSRQVDLTPYAPCMRRCMGSRTPYYTTTAEPLTGTCLWSSCGLLLCQDLLGCRAIAISTGRALVVRHALEPLPCATLGTGMPRGMVHREQVWCRCRRLFRCHRKQDAPLEMSGVSVSLAGTRRSLVCWSRSLQACANMRHRRVGPRGTVWLQAED